MGRINRIYGQPTPRGPVSPSASPGYRGQYGFIID
jgi:hypothetical protein